MKLKCIVVDDSILQRITITKLVNQNTNLQLIGEFSNAIDAKNFLSEKVVDLIFLDIEMPSISGFDFLDDLKERPQIIFITVSQGYAIKAFDYSATDYLLKPLSKERFSVSVEKAIAFHNLKLESKIVIEEDFIFVKSNYKQIKVFLPKIKWVEAYGDYIKIVTDTDNYLVLSTMKNFIDELQLHSSNFMRVHKSYIINLDRVVSVTSKFIEIANQKIPLSRNCKEDLFAALQKNE